MRGKTLYSKYAERTKCLDRVNDVIDGKVRCLVSKVVEVHLHPINPDMSWLIVDHRKMT